MTSLFENSEWMRHTPFILRHTPNREKWFPPRRPESHLLSLDIAMSDTVLFFIKKKATSKKRQKSGISVSTAAKKVAHFPYFFSGKTMFFGKSVVLLKNRCFLKRNQNKIKKKLNR